MKRLGLIGAAVPATAAAIFAVLSLSGGAGSPLAEAGERMAGQSMRMTLDMSFPWPEGQTDVTGTGVSSADGTRVILRARYTLPGVPEKMPLTMRMIGDDLWFRYTGTYRSLMPGGKTWVHGRDTTTPSEGLTPSEYARFLANADDVEKVDDDAPINGKPTTYYKGLVNVAEIAEEIGGETEDRFDRLIGGRDIRVPVQAWIGRDGLPVRINVQMKDSKGRPVKLNIDVLEYGVPVDVEPPLAAATIEEREFDELTAP